MSQSPSVNPQPQLLLSLWLLVVVGLTSAAGYAAWRDTQREVRIAEMRSQFVASVSHELKTPLTSIRMFAELLGMHATDERTQAEYLDTIVNESERLTRLLNNVLDFSRIDHGQKRYSMSPTHLDEVVNSVIRVMNYPLTAQGFALHVDVDPTLPAIAADRDAIIQALLNLMTNAMKYSGKERTIELRLGRKGEDVLLQVTDRGIGIPTHEQPRVFEKFYRANVPENQAISGTGLGLALVAHIVSGHRGSINVDSRLGAGTTVTIRLPMLAAGGDSVSDTSHGRTVANRSSGDAALTVETHS
jgi:two-component system phosphate regulon sensor histidine kinase PhoR